MGQTIKKIIEDICLENNIKIHLLSKNWVIVLEKDGKTRFIRGYKFDSNLHGIGLIVDDKYALYEVLKYKNIPVAEHKIVYDKNNNLDYAIGCNTYEYVKNFFLMNNNHIVIKANNGTCGRNVYNVTDINEIEYLLNDIFNKNYSISICPFYNIEHEYRVIVLNGEVKLIYAKYLPIVVGDGIKTIKQLLIEFNYEYFFDRLQDEKYNVVLNKGEIYQYNWKYNLSQGSIAKKLTDENLINILANMAKKVANEINLGFGSIDIIETTDNKFLVLEINSGVMLENYVRLNPDDYLLVKDIYNEAINNLFID